MSKSMTEEELFSESPLGDGERKTGFNSDRKDMVFRSKNNQVRREFLKEYCESSTIQGLAYIIKDITIFERLWWFIVFIAGISGSSFMIHHILDKWNTTPVLVSISPKEMQTHNIPFPAVTVCPEAKVSTKCLNYTRILMARNQGKLTAQHAKESAYFDQMALLCKPENHQEMLELSGKNWTELEKDNLNDSNDDTEDHIDVKVNMDDYSDFFFNCSAVSYKDVKCQWMGRFVECEDIMTPIVTDEGLCYSFNMFDVRDIYSKVNTMQYLKEGNRNLTWDPDKGYNKHELPEHSYPRRSYLTGAKNSFTAIFLTKEDELNYACRNFALQGIRVSLHPPSNIPRPSQVFFSVGLNRLTNVAIKPSLTHTSKRIRHYTPEQRMCFFGHERHLKFFDMYSQSNCNMECFTNYTVRQCGCVNFYMPRDNKTRVCALADLKCLDISKSTYTQSVLRERLHKTETTSCKCFPLCSELKYDAEISTGEWNYINPDEATIDSIADEIKGYHASAVRVYLKDFYFLPHRRDELYGFTDVISNTGGVLGSFMGFSLFSLAEIIYFLSMKLLDTCKRIMN